MKNSVIALLLASAGLVPCDAQEYTRQVIMMGLDQPRGISVNAAHDLYFTELPTPGVPGSMGGTNRVSRVSGATGMTTVVETGMPEPLNLAMNGSQVFWTCRTAGVIFTSSPGGNQIYMSGLMRPTGIFAMDNGEVYVTQVPTPGVSGANGGTNGVLSISGSQITTVSSGEPEPADVVVDADGNGYWTCATAGVILRLDAVTGVRAPVVRGLERPTGLAIDAAGALYFTEVPTPGVGGGAGGRNKVWRLDPVLRAFTLISFGEPEPFDVAVTPDGASVYWTCTTAGVIIRADRVGPTPTVTPVGAGDLGTTLRFFLDAPSSPGMPYVAASSFGLGPIKVDTRYVALNVDGLLTETLLNTGSSIFVGYNGTLDANGMGTAQLAIPNDPALSGMAFYTAFVVVDPSSPSSVGAISSTLLSVIQ